MPKDDFDYVELVRRIKDLTPRTRLYNILKQQLILKGYWKNKPRGNPAKGWENAHL